MFTRTFWADAGERALKTAAQFVLGMLVGSAAPDSITPDAVQNAFTLDFGALAGAGLFGLLVSLAFSIASAPFANRGTASLTDKIESTEV